MARAPRSWLDDGLGKYVEIFVANDVDLDLLPELEAEDFMCLHALRLHKRAARSCRKYNWRGDVFARCGSQCGAWA